MVLDYLHGTDVLRVEIPGGHSVIAAEHVHALDVEVLYPLPVVDYLSVSGYLYPRHFPQNVLKDDVLLAGVCGGVE